MPRSAFVLLAILVLPAMSACRQWHIGGDAAARCAPAVADDGREQLYTFGRELLTDSAWAKLRQFEGLRGAPGTVRWVTEEWACRRFDEALASASGRPADHTSPLAAVHVGAFYLVRFEERSAPWLLSPDFHLRRVFVVPN